MRNAFQRLLIIAVSLASASSFPSISRADYIVNFGTFGGINRITEGGTIVRGYGAPPNAPIETDNEDYAVTPDFKTVYDFPNSLGYADIIYASDVETGQTQPTKYLNPAFGPQTDDHILLPRQALVRSNGSIAAADLYVISADPNAFVVPPTKDFIKHYNIPANQYVETIRPPTSVHIYDFAFGPDNRLYISADSGILRYSANPLPSPPFPQSFNWETILPNVNGMITFGPDDRLYLRDRATGNIDRYTTSGTFLNTFIASPLIPTNDFADTQSIQFGVDGNLIVNSYFTGAPNFPNLIRKFDGTTGTLLSTTSVVNRIARGRIAFLPVPEPSLLALALGAISCRPPTRGIC